MIPAPSFIERYGSQCEARFEAGHDTVAVTLSTGNTTGRIYAHRPFYLYRSWEPGPEAVRDYQRIALAAFTSGFGRIETDRDGDLFAVV